MSDSPSAVVRWSNLTLSGFCAASGAVEMDRTMTVESNEQNNERMSDLFVIFINLSICLRSVGVGNDRILIAPPIFRRIKGLVSDSHELPSGTGLCRYRTRGKD